MKGILQFFKMTFMGGILFLVPIIVLIIVMGKALKVTGTLIAPISSRIPIESVGAVASVELLAILAIVSFCFLSGLFARTNVAKAMVRKIEDTFLSNVPGYSFIKGMGESATGFDSEKARHPVLARFDDGWQVGFFMERLEDGHLCIFIPDAPNPLSGSVFFMEEERIRPLDVPAMSAIKCMRQLGLGANALVKGSLGMDEIA